MRLAEPVLADEDHVGGLLDEVQREEPLHLRAVDLLGMGEVERVERLDHREARLGETVLHEPFELPRGLGRDEAIEEHLRRDIILCGRLRLVPVSLGRDLEPEEVEILGEPLVEIGLRGPHQASLCSVSSTRRRS